MTTAYLSTTLIAIAADGFSGIAALLHFQPIMPGMAKAGVPVSWLTFPIGTLKTLGALGLAAGLLVRPLGISAAIGLVLGPVLERSLLQALTIGRGELRELWSSAPAAIMLATAAVVLLAPAARAGLRLWTRGRASRGGDHYS